MNLAAAGFVNGDVHICFRNNSDDKFLIRIDDIQVEEALDNNLAVGSIEDAPEYTQYPIQVGSPSIPLSMEVVNLGNLSQSNFSAEVDILRDGAFVTTLGASLDGPLAPAEAVLIDLGAYEVTVPGVYSLNYVVRLETGTEDDAPGDNALTLDNVITVTTDVMARDDGTITGALGIGADNEEGFLGQQFTLENEAVIDRAFFVYSNANCGPSGECGLDGESLNIVLLEFDSLAQKPGDVIASTDPHIVPAGVAEPTQVTVAFPGPILLQPGTYVLVLREPAQPNSALSSSVRLATTTERFTPGTTWVNWPSAPSGDWANSEDYGFSVSYVIRPIFLFLDDVFEDRFESE